MSTRYYHEDSKSLDTLWELREIDAWADGEGGWTWNDSFVLKRFRSDADDLKGLFLRVLADVRGRPLTRGVFRVDDSDRYARLRDGAVDPELTFVVSYPRRPDRMTRT